MTPFSCFPIKSPFEGNFRDIPETVEGLMGDAVWIRATVLFVVTFAQNLSFS
jgi:hypothetical protein